jgi:hypothetical protein
VKTGRGPDRLTRYVQTSVTHAYRMGLGRVTEDVRTAVAHAYRKGTGRVTGHVQIAVVTDGAVDLNCRGT